MASKNLQRTTLEALPTERLVRIYFDFVLTAFGDPRVPSRDEAIEALLIEVKSGPAWFIDFVNASTVKELRGVIRALGGTVPPGKKAMVKEIGRALEGR